MRLPRDIWVVVAGAKGKDIILKTRHKTAPKSLHA